MKNGEVINRILAYHPNLLHYNGCDGDKCGSPEDECTGVAVTKVALVGHLFPNCFMQDGVVNELLSDVANAPKVTYIQTEDGFNYV